MLPVAAIVTYTTSGSTTLRASRSGPRADRQPDAEPCDARRLTLAWGVHVVHTKDVADCRRDGRQCGSHARDKGFARPGDTILISAGMPFGTPARRICCALPKSEFYPHTDRRSGAHYDRNRTLSVTAQGELRGVSRPRLRSITAACQQQLKVRHHAANNRGSQGNLPGEKRVATVPDVVAKLKKLGFDVVVNPVRATRRASPTTRIARPGRPVVPDAASVWSSADIIFKVRAPTPQEVR
jgi:hypothetical protein